VWGRRFESGSRGAPAEESRGDLARERFGFGAESAAHGVRVAGDLTTRAGDFSFGRGARFAHGDLMRATRFFDQPHLLAVRRLACLAHGIVVACE
jgi:hypothetical protein